jgi:solute:Na+ symporter, SSS family
VHFDEGWDEIMIPTFGWLDWSVVLIYFAIMLAGGIAFAPRQTGDARDYFLAGGQIPSWLAAISVLTATLSAATFLGGPDYGYRGDYTYLSTNVGGLLAGVFVARILIPRYYALGVTTVYELLGMRFGTPAMRAAGGMFLVGRVLAGGTRVYLGAIAISMIMFGDVSASGIFFASLALIVLSFVFTFAGGLKSVIWNDLIQFVIYVGAAFAILIFLWWLIPASGSEIVGALRNAPDGANKLRLFDLSVGVSQPFSLLAILTGGFLLSVGNFGLDQDTTQRLLACKDARTGARSLILSVLITIPIIWVFISIGELLHIFYDRPDLMQHRTDVALTQTFQGQKISIFMHFILTQIPPGLRGLATVGIIAAAVATTNSAMNAMSSVLIEDFYRPLRSDRTEAHYVHAGRMGMALMGLLMFAMSLLSYYWQRYANLPILEFVLAIMTFAYAGLLGVYFTAIFTRRGSNGSVILALAAGFLTILLLQKYTIDFLGLPDAWKALAFPWQLCVGTLISFLTCAAGSQQWAPNAVPFDSSNPRGLNAQH